MICTRNGNWMLSQALSVELEGSKTVPKTLICCTLPCCKLQHWCFWRCCCNAHLSSYFSGSTAYEERWYSPLTFKANSNITNNPLKRPFPTPNMQIRNLLSLRYNARNKGGTSLIYTYICMISQQVLIIGLHAKKISRILCAFTVEPSHETYAMPLLTSASCSNSHRLALQVLAHKSASLHWEQSTWNYQVLVRTLIFCWTYNKTHINNMLVNPPRMANPNNQLEKIKICSAN